MDNAGKKEEIQNTLDIQVRIRLQEVHTYVSKGIQNKNKFLIKNISPGDEIPSYKFQENLGDVRMKC